MTDWIILRETEAVERVKAELAKPMAECREYCGAEGTFDPWALFPSIYGTYSSAFGEAMLLVLRNIQLACERPHGELAPEDLVHEIFREMLCQANLCDYGTSPRVCFATEPFKEVLPELIERWAEFEKLWWA